MRTTLLLVLLLLPACPADDDVDVDSRAVCDCPDLGAADIPYDNTSSGLAGTDVQAAADELAARPQPVEDAYERILLVSTTATSLSSGTTHQIQVNCPDVPGEPDKAALALGGSCHSATSNAIIKDTELVPDGSGHAQNLRCIWSKPEGEAIEFTASVTCLGKAGVTYE